jgi:hypothetical protein
MARVSVATEAESWLSCLCREEIDLGVDVTVSSSGKLGARDARLAHACTSCGPTNHIQARVTLMHYFPWRRLKDGRRANTLREGHASFEWPRY